MPRSVYFSFHYQDVMDFRANVVRNSGTFRQKGDIFRDSSIWEEAEEKAIRKVKGLIEAELIGASVNCVLIGTDTYSRRFVRYEIMKSLEAKKGQLGVGINWIRDKNGSRKFWAGENPFDYLALKIAKDGKSINLFEKKESSWIAYKDLPAIKNTQFKENDFGNFFRLSNLYKRYSYLWNNGKVYFPSWIEEAAINVGR